MRTSLVRPRQPPVDAMLALGASHVHIDRWVPSLRSALCRWCSATRPRSPLNNRWLDLVAHMTERRNALRMSICGLLVVGVATQRALVPCLCKVVDAATKTGLAQSAGAVSHKVKAHIVERWKILHDGLF